MGQNLTVVIVIYRNIEYLIKNTYYTIQLLSIYQKMKTNNNQPK